MSTSQANSISSNAVAGWIPAREAFEKEEQYARKALALDDSLPEAHNSMAAFYFFSGWDWHKAEAESLRAIELNPNYAEARHIHSYILLVMNREEEAVQEQKRSSELDPFGRPEALGGAYLHARQYDAAINDLRVHAEIQPQDVFVQFFLFEAYWFKGMKKEAIQSLQQLFVAEGDRDHGVVHRHGVHHASGCVPHGRGRGVRCHPAGRADHRHGDDRLFHHHHFADTQHARAALGHLVAEAGGDDGDLDLVFHLLVEYGAEDDVGVLMRGRLNER